MTVEDLERELFGVRCTLRQFEPRVVRYVSLRLDGALRGEEAARAEFVSQTVTRLQAREAALVQAIEDEREAERQRRVTVRALLVTFPTMRGRTTVLPRR